MKILRPRKCPPCHPKLFQFTLGHLFFWTSFCAILWLCDLHFYFNSVCLVALEPHGLSTGDAPRDHAVDFGLSLSLAGDQDQRQRPGWPIPTGTQPVERRSGWRGNPVNPKGRKAAGSCPGGGRPRGQTPNLTTWPSLSRTLLASQNLALGPWWTLEVWPEAPGTRLSLRMSFYLKLLNLSTSITTPSKSKAFLCLAVPVLSSG